MCLYRIVYDLVADLPDSVFFAVVHASWSDLGIWAVQDSDGSGSEIVGLGRARAFLLRARAGRAFTHSLWAGPGLALHFFGPGRALQMTIREPFKGHFEE